MNSDCKPFSEREGFVVPVYQTVQIDRPTRTRIYNTFNFYFLDRLNYFRDCPELYHDFADHSSDQYWKGRDIALRNFFWSAFFAYPLDEYRADDCLFCIRKMMIEDDPWHRCFDFVENILRCCTGRYEVDSLNVFFHKEMATLLISGISQVMRDMKVGYIIMDNKFVPIFSEQEKQEIEKAYTTQFDGANQHIKKAITLFANRENPDYENSIKESISAVESVAKEITGKRKSLNALTQELRLHDNFRRGLDELYNWTSKKGGMRHGKSGDSLPPNKNTARFMLIICSAFVNYIISRNPQQHKR